MDLLGFGWARLSSLFLIANSPLHRLSLDETTATATGTSEPCNERFKFNDSMVSTRASEEPGEPTKFKSGEESSETNGLH